MEARDYAGNASAPLQVPIDVAPLWWERVSVRLAARWPCWSWAMPRSRRTRNLRAQRHALELQVRERTARLSEANARLLDPLYRDALTGLANRRSLLEALESGGGAAALLFLDVDHFRDYNDCLGHPAGDEALRAVGRCYSLLLRPPPGWRAMAARNSPACCPVWTPPRRATAEAHPPRRGAARCPFRAVTRWAASR